MPKLNICLFGWSLLSKKEMSKKKEQVVSENDKDPGTN